MGITGGAGKLEERMENHDEGAVRVDARVRRALRQTFNENHRKRTGRDAPESWLNNSMKHIERDAIWKRVLEILADA